LEFFDGSFLRTDTLSDALPPLLSKWLLDDLDRELQRRGHTFCRIADGCNITVWSFAGGERVLPSLTKFLDGKLRLKVNQHKTAVATSNNT
jgi:RNA-directed DNA polymerase